MRVAVFGYPRSGTTMLQDIILRHLVAAGLTDWSQNLAEPFNPLEYTRLVPYADGGELRVKRLSNSPRRMLEGKQIDLPGPFQTREERFELFAQSSGDYVLKMLAQDTKDPRILPWLIDHEYHIVTIERRDHFEALLSWLVAWYHQRWSVLEKDERPEYQPFEANMDEIMVICGFIARYLHFKQFIPNAYHVYYEDMCRMAPEELLRHVGLYQDGAEAPATEWKKLHSYGEKAKLIINLDEVRDCYERTVATLL